MVIVRFIPTRVGYTYALLILCFNKTGSSPLAWGIHPTASCTWVRFRFIPTRVGYTFHIMPTIFDCFGSSPLAWGILNFATKFLDVKYGSSPLAWGIPNPPPIHRAFHRFIPTRVGYTLYCWMSVLLFVGSSPLAWGIRLAVAGPLFLYCGSSPLAWGIR